MSRKQLALLEPTLVRQALLDAVKKLSPTVQWRNPVMFIVWIGSLITTLLAVAMASGHLAGSAAFTAAVSIWLWFTVLFANFAEAMAEGRSKAQANSLKGVKKPLLLASCARRSMMRLSTIFRPRIYAKAMWCWWKQAILFPATGKSLKAAPRWTKAPSPVNPLR
jgi:high-affinity K+ transport system ATPase subunit B